MRRDSFNKYHICFPKGINHCEDLLTWVQLCQHSEIKVAYLPKAFYHYYVNSNSITRHFTRFMYEMRLKYLAKLYEILSPKYESIKQQAAFDVFTEAIMFNVLSNNEVLAGLKRFQRQIYNINSLKWKLGFVFLRIGMNRLASKLVHY